MTVAAPPTSLLARAKQALEELEREQSAELVRRYEERERARLRHLHELLRTKLDVHVMSATLPIQVDGLWFTIAGHEESPLEASWLTMVARCEACALFTGNDDPVDSLADVALVLRRPYLPRSCRHCGADLTWPTL